MEHGAHRKPHAGWRRTALTSPGCPAGYGDPPRTTRWPPTWRPGGGSGQPDALRLGRGRAHRVLRPTVTGALGRGVTQVVVGAAYYDGRAFRYAPSRASGWFEVDHPATQRDKLERLERLGIDASHVRFVEADSPPATRWPT